MSRQGASDNEVGDYCDYGDYEDVGTPVVPTRVGFLTHTILETGLVYAFTPATYCRKILPLLSLTLSPPQMAWLKGKMGRLDSIRSNRSISSSSTYIYGMGARKQIHKSQLSLYDKISRKISLGRPASRKSSYGHAHVRR